MAINGLRCIWQENQRRQINKFVKEAREDIQMQIYTWRKWLLSEYSLPLSKTQNRGIVERVEKVHVMVRIRLENLIKVPVKVRIKLGNLKNKLWRL